MPRHYDILIIGGGHAGAEAAWAASRLGCSTALITLDPQKIGAMSCNPAIGGLAKGQMVREIDALGGLMGLATDATGIQFRMLNRSKGPAVWGPRAQADKYKYAAEVQRLLQTCPNLQIVPGEVAELMVEGGVSTVEGARRAEAAQPSTLHTPHSAIAGVKLATGETITCTAVIVTTGTFLRALMHTGESKTEGGRVGEQSARGLSASLKAHGLAVGRLKTGTPPRLHRDSIDFTKFELQPGDAEPMPFSYMNEYEELRISDCRLRNEGEADAVPSSFRNLQSEIRNRWTPPLPQITCWLGETSPAIHDIIRANLHRAPMYSGQIESTGPRYCPSIEDKVVRFADKHSHHLFLEPEGLDTPEIYVNGISTSLPADVQDQIVRMIPGLQNAQFIRYGYAVEYDMVWPSEIRSTLETKKVAGLFLAGQINGTSGYEEAAAQGMMAGINAARLVKTGKTDFVLRRDQAYIGVLIDDLVTKPPIEPYRMFTSRAEHRLNLRADNADDRLTEIGRQIGLVSDDRWTKFESMRATASSTFALLEQTRSAGTSLMDRLRRTDVEWKDVVAAEPSLAAVAPNIARRVEIRAKYAGYLARQDRAIERMADLEEKLIPERTNYAAVVGLRNEARAKLTQFTPRSLGQALRISGITPADVTVLAVHLSRGASR